MHVGVLSFCIYCSLYGAVATGRLIVNEYGAVVKRQLIGKAE